jgi:hypothetical protein
VLSRNLENEEALAHWGAVAPPPKKKNVTYFALSAHNISHPKQYFTLIFIRSFCISRAQWIKRSFKERNTQDM